MESIEQQIYQKATSREFFQFGLNTKEDILKNVKKIVEYKVMIDNKYTNKTRNKNISNESDRTEVMNLAILYKRLSVNLGEKLIPQLQKMSQRDQEIQRMLKMVQGMPNDSEQKVAVLVGKLQGGGNNKVMSGMSTAMPKMVMQQSIYPTFDSQAKQAPSAYPSFGPPQPKTSTYPTMNAYQTSSQTYGQGGYPTMSSGYPDMSANNAYSKTNNAYPSNNSYPSNNALSNSTKFDAQLAQQMSSSSSLKQVVCPMEIINDFLRIAELNTSIKVETCAVLAGREEDNYFVITHLIVPRQEGHQDHCFMTDEISMFEAQLQHNVITVGWIHTHPQFDLFLSSVDLHNQLGYQLQLPEAVAIVYSPIVPNPKFKAFRVKTNQIKNIQNCQLSGFHEHKDPAGQPCWEVCQHLQYASVGQVKTNVIDLR